MVTSFASPKSSLYEDGGWQEFQAAATNIDGFTCRTDYMDMIGKYLRRNTIFWPLLRKEKAEADVVREILEAQLPSTGFFSKTSMNPPENAPSAQSNDLSDVGQEVKAGGGLIKISHYGRSLATQQGQPWGNQLAQKTENLIVATSQTLERTLFAGNATSSPLQFNGIQRQMAAGHAFTGDISAGDSVVKKLRAIARLAVNDESIVRNITHIFTSGLGLQLIEDEVETKLEYHNMDNIRPGLKVPAIITQGSNQGEPTPIVTSPYLRDTDAGGAGTDTVHFWLVDMNLLCWKGVVPYGVQDTSSQNVYNPQIFEIASAASPYLIDSRLCLFYGTLYAKNRGQGIYKLSMTVPANTVSSV